MRTSRTAANVRRWTDLARQPTDFETLLYFHVLSCDTAQESLYAFHCDRNAVAALITNALASSEVLTVKHIKSNEFPSGTGKYQAASVIKIKDFVAQCGAKSKSV